MMESPRCRWNAVLFWTTQLLLRWSLGVQAQQPTPAPTLFDGYDYAQCAIDVFASDRNDDGFISRNELEYLELINRVGASVCFQQTTPLTAVQQSAYFRLVCDILADCRYSSELPVTGLTAEQITQICVETRAIVFSTCPEPTASPVVGGPPTPTSPTGTPAPTQPFDPVAPDVSLAQCREDLNGADADGDERITRAEFVVFLEALGERVCYERETEGAELSDLESSVFDALVCLATEECEGVTEIDISLPSFTPSIAFTLCQVTYSSGMNSPVCESQETPVGTAAPTSNPDEGSQRETTVAPVASPPTGGAAPAFNVGGATLLVTGVATMLAYMWM